MVLCDIRFYKTQTLFKNLYSRSDFDLRYINLNIPESQNKVYKLLGLTRPTKLNHPLRNNKLTSLSQLWKFDQGPQTMPVRHVVRTEPVIDEVDMTYANADEEYEADSLSDSDSDSEYIPPDGYDSLDNDEPLPPRRSSRESRKSAQGRTEMGLDELPVENTIGNPNELELDITERTSPPIIPSTLPQKIKDVLNLIAVQHGTLAGGEVQHIALDYIQNSMDPIILQLIASVLALAPETILAQVASSVAQIVYNCWINRTESFMLGEVLAIQKENDDNHIIPFLEQLRYRDVEASFTRTDW